jgi:IPT/TIG domain/Putative Ig domain
MSQFKSSLYLTSQKRSGIRCTLRRLRNHMHHFALVCLSLATILTTGCGVTSQAQNSTAATAIKSISPTSVVAGGPSFTLAVSGTGFTSDSVVTVNNQVRTTTFVSATQLKAVILASDIGNPGTKPLSVFNVHSFVPAFDSAALSVQPSTSSQGSTLQITTTGLPAGAVGVSYSAALAAANGVPPYTWRVSSGQLPPGLNLQASTGQISGTPSQAGTFSVTVQVTDSSNQFISAGFSANIAPQSSPVVTGVSPNSGPTSGGSSVTITGSNFLAGATVSIGGSAASSVTVSSSTQIRAVTPAHLAGNADVVIQDPNGEASTLSNGFAYNVPSPTVASVSPNNGPTAGGTRVTITGTNFLAGALILFGTTSATSVVVNSATQIQATTPAHAAGLAQVTVEDPGNVSANLASGFTYNSSSLGPPTISSVSPTTGPPGTQVTITGTNFETGATVAFGSTSAPSTVFVSSTQLTASVPTIAAGTYSLTATDPDPISSAPSSSFTVTIPPPAQSLLSGCTVSASNTSSCPTPSGWTLVAAQGFEGGSTNGVVSGTVSNIGSSAHTGSYALTTYVSYDQAGPSWATNTSQIGTFTSVYISEWEWLDSNAKLNDETFLADLINPTSPSPAQEIIIDRYNPGTTENPSATKVVAESQGNASGVHNGTLYAGTHSTAGGWHQWEIEYTPNTPGNSDGSIYIYLDGALITPTGGQYSFVNVNINGTVTMSGNSMVQVGGVYSLLLWTSTGSTRGTPGSCEPVGSGQGNAIGNGGTSFATYSAACPTQFSANGGLTGFNRYIDDIIVLKK